MPPILPGGRQADGSSQPKIHVTKQGTVKASAPKKAPPKLPSDICPEGEQTLANQARVEFDPNA